MPRSTTALRRAEIREVPQSILIRYRRNEYDEHIFKSDQLLGLLHYGSDLPKLFGTLPQVVGDLVRFECGQNAHYVMDAHLLSVAAFRAATEGLPLNSEFEFRVQQRR